MRLLLLVLALASLPRAATEPAPVPDRAAATAAVTRYLADHGDFCLGKMDWPVDISALDERAHGRDVMQMPVLESLGLVRSRPATALRVEGAGAGRGRARRRRWPCAATTLTPLGERFMREREIVVPGPEGDRRVRRADLCAAHLSLRGRRWWRRRADAESLRSRPTPTRSRRAVGSVAGFPRAFPMAARVIDGARRMQLKQAFAWKDGAWTPAGLAD